MEERRIGHNQDSYLPKPQSDGEFLARWLAKSEQSESIDTEEDEDDSEESKKPASKRWRRFWRRLFKRIETPEDTSKSREPSQYQQTMDNLFSETRSVDERPEAPTDSHSEVESETEHSSASESEQEERFELGSDKSKNESSSIEGETEKEPAAQTYENPEVQPKLAEANSHEDVVEFRTREEAGLTQYEQVVFDRSSSSESPRETRYEAPRGAIAAAVGLVGAEYFGRKRADRRLKREIDQLQKRVRDGERASKQLQSIAKESKDQRRELQQRQKDFEARLPERSHQAAEKVVATPKYESKPMQPKESAEKRPEVFREAEGLIDMSENSPAPVISPEKTPNIKEDTPEKPEAVFKKVIAAAEHDDPIERSYERRHEIKDEAGAPLGTGSGPVSIGSIMAGMNDSLPAQPASRAHPAPSPRQNDITVQQNGPSMYDQAVQRGFWGGVIVIIFVMLLAVLY